MMPWIDTPYGPVCHDGSKTPEQVLAWVSAVNEYRTPDDVKSRAFAAEYRRKVAKARRRRLGLD
jgi:hypothetical protein